MLRIAARAGIFGLLHITTRPPLTCRINDAATILGSRLVLKQRIPGSSRPLVFAADRSLAALAPEVAAQWHSTKNGNVTPADVASRTSKTYWWRCMDGPDHEWETSPRIRVGKGTGCPFCSHRTVSMTNSLATLAPIVAAQWHPTKNADVTPADITSQTGKKYWWQCDVGADHEWEASPGDRVGKGTGCPYCSGHRVSMTNSFAAIKPSAAAWWDSALNGSGPDDILAGSNKKYWFNIPELDCVQRSPNSFKREDVIVGDAKKSKRLNTAVTLAVGAPEVAVQWHPTKNGGMTPMDVASRTSKKYWWRCGENLDHEWEARVSNRVGSGTGCPYCSGRQVSITNSLAVLAPAVAAQWHPTKNGDMTPADVTSKSGKLCSWRCEKGEDHEWEARVSRRVGSGTGCPFCCGKKVSASNSLAAIAPEVAAQWHPTGNGKVTPVHVTSQTNKKYWWKCDKGPDHEWKASPANRVGKGATGCPCCSRRQVSVTNNAILAKLSYLF